MLKTPVSTILTTSLRPACVVLLGVFSFAGCAQREVIVEHRGPRPVVQEEIIVDRGGPPPPDRVEVVGVAPHHGARWVRGHWVRHDHHWIWKRGHWV